MTSDASQASVAAAYERHGHHVLRRARMLLGSESDAGEILQEVFLDLLTNPSQFAGRSSLTTWLYSATTHRCLNRLRDTRARSRIVSERGRALPTTTSGTQAEDIAELRQLLRRLSPELATVAVYYYGDEMTQEEIAQVIGRSRRHVCNLIERLEEEVSPRKGVAR